MPPSVVNPAKVPKGTSYEAKGIVSPPSNLEAEIGSAGFSGLREIVPELATRAQRLQTFQKMVNTDAATAVSVKASKTPVFGAEFWVEPFSDSQDHIEHAEFVFNNIFEGQSYPWLICLEEICRFFEKGFSILEPVWENREWAPRRSGANRRKYTMLRKLAPRPAESIKEFMYDDAGGPEGLKQNAVRKEGRVEEVEIPIDKLLIFTLDKQGGDLEGRSILRTAYAHWFYKNHLYKIDAIQKERHGTGFPIVRLVAGHTTEDRTAALKLVRNIRANETGGGVLPPGYELEFKKVEGQLVDVLKSIDHHNGMIMLNAFVQFLLLGLQEGGGRATSAAHLDMFQKSLRYVANLICDSFNMYLIPKIIGYNFETYDYPKMRARNLGGARELQQWAAALSNLLAQAGITPDMELEQWLRKQFDAPAKMEPRPEVDASTNGGKRKGDIDANRIKTDNIGKVEDEA
jgi:hypothetical protein